MRPDVGADAGRFVPRGHPLRRTNPLAEPVLVRMSSPFDEFYASGGRLSIPLEVYHKVPLLMAVFDGRLERSCCEQPRCVPPFQSLLNLNAEDEPFVPTTFRENQEWPKLVDTLDGHRDG